MSASKKSTRPKAKSRLIFFGTPDFAAEILSSLLKYFLVEAVVTQPDRPVGRQQEFKPSPVKELALKQNLPILQPEQFKKNQPIITQLKSFNPDLFVVAAYGQIIPKDILDLPRNGALNVHASLLPSYRGASPIQAVIKNGESGTGVTIILMDEKLDHGPILAQKRLAISSTETGQTLQTKLAELGSKLLIKTIEDWLQGKIKPIPQDHLKATRTKILKREDGHIDWSKSATEIDRQIRAFTPWPGTFTQFNNQRLKINQARILNPKIGCAENAQIGQVFKTAKGEFSVNCGLGSLILEWVQLEGKKELKGREFLNGYPAIVGVILK